MRLTLIKH